MPACACMWWVVVAENLMEIKRHKLLLMLHETPPLSPPQQEGPGAVEQGEAPCKDGELAYPSVEGDGISGMKCRAPLKEVSGRKLFPYIALPPLTPHPSLSLPSPGVGRATMMPLCYIWKHLPLTHLPTQPMTLRFDSSSRSPCTLP